MGLIPNLNVDTSIQIIVIVLVGCIVLISVIAIIACCCSRNKVASDLQTVHTQKRKYAPRPASDASHTQFPVLIISVPFWEVLVAADRVHARGADLRLKRLIARLCAQHGAYYCVETEDTSSSGVNRKVIVSNSVDSLLRVAKDVFTTTSISDFCNNTEANYQLRQALLSSQSSSTPEDIPWAGLPLVAAFHFGDGDVSTTSAASPSENGGEGGDDNKDSDNGVLTVDGQVVQDAISLLHAQRNDISGSCLASAAFTAACNQEEKVTLDAFTPNEFVGDAAFNQKVLADLQPMTKLTLLPVNQRVSVMAIHVSLPVSPAKQREGEDNAIVPATQLHVGPADSRAGSSNGNTAVDPRTVPSPNDEGVEVEDL